MRILEWNEFSKGSSLFGQKDTSITVGIFDGVHRGHAALIERIIHHDKNLVPVIVTFRQNHKKRPADISGFTQKIECFENLGVQITVIADLTEEFRMMNGSEFLKVLRETGRMKFLAVGGNFRCGFNQDTDAAKIREINSAAGIPTEIVEVMTEEGVPISSSRIRNAIIHGQLNDAVIMLGHPFVLDLRDIKFEVDKHEEALFDIAGAGRTLPGPGTYMVMLRGKTDVKKASAQIAEGKLRIPCVKTEFVEFCPE